ncbi:MAG: cobalt transporter [Chloroflexi bacterium]|nr:cobalt transporter [Chloroflexota bacterium]
MKNLGKIIAIGILIVIVCLAIVGWIVLSKQAPEGEEGPWGGVDVTVIEKYASDAGREAREPFINTDKGDMLLFVFALGGTVGGFAAGYYWRRLVMEKS